MFAAQCSVSSSTNQTTNKPKRSTVPPNNDSSFLATCFSVFVKFLFAFALDYSPCPVPPALSRFNNRVYSFARSPSTNGFCRRTNAAVPPTKRLSEMLSTFFFFLFFSFLFLTTVPATNKLTTIYIFFYN